MPKAVWKGTVVAESPLTVVVEGNHYFPPDAVRREYLEKSPTRTLCPWKGVAAYYSLRVNGETIEDAAWTYADPKEAARHIRDHVAFWRGVRVEP